MGFIYSFSIFFSSTDGCSWVIIFEWSIRSFSFFSEYVSLNVGKFLYDLKLIMRHFLRTHLIWQVFIELETNAIFSRKKKTWVLFLKRNWNRLKTLQIDVSKTIYMNSRGLFKICISETFMSESIQTKTINWYVDLMN